MSRAADLRQSTSHKVGRLLLLAFIVAATLGAGPALAQQDASSYVAEPAPGSSVSRGGYFELGLSPGEQATQTLALQNVSDEPLELRLAAVDAVTGALGGVSYGLPDDDPTRMGSWLSLRETTLRLAPNASASVPFDIRVPADARSGAHLGGIAVSSPQDLSQPDANGGGGAAVEVQTRKIVAVQVNLPGPADPELIVEGVRAAARGDGLYLEVVIANVGFGLTKAEGTVSLPGTEFRRDFTVDTFVPDTEIGYPVKWTEEEAAGEHAAEVVLRYGDEPPVEWSGTFTVGEEVREDLADRRGQTGGLGEKVRDLPLGWIAGIVGLIVALAAGVLLGRRTAARAGSSPPSPPAPPETVATKSSPDTPK